MKLKEFINMQEMSLPQIKSEEEAVDTIRKAYQDAVVRKQPHGDWLGPVNQALRFLQGVTNPEKYAVEVKKGIAAKKAMEAYRAGKATQQAKFTTVR